MTSLAHAESGTKLTGLLHVELHAPMPVTLDVPTRLTSRLVNVCPLPLQVEIGETTYAPDFVHANLIRAKMPHDLDEAVWGPPCGKYLVPNPERILVSGVGAMDKPRWVPDWPDKRDGITLLTNEGYARFVTILPGWLDAKEIPEGTSKIAIDVGAPLSMRLPKREPGAVLPGKPIKFANFEETDAPSSRAVAFKRSGQKPAKAEEPAAPKEFELGAEIEIDGPVEAGKDVTVTYLIGNTGTRAVWIWQNSLVPALAKWEVFKDKKSVSSIDGSALKFALDLLPERAPIPLNPGEYLVYRRALLAGKLPLARGSSYQLNLSLDAQWSKAKPGDADKPESIPLSATTVLQAK
jgi:hypothetical protein